MDEADAEWYLRRCAEDELLVDRRPMLRDRADALVAVGAVSRETADAVVTVYDRARNQRKRPVFVMEESRASDPSRLRPLRVTYCGRTFDQPWGKLTVDYVVADVDSIRLEVRIAGGRNLMTGPRARTPTVEITDSWGARHVAEFSGRGGSSRDWNGHYVITPPSPAGVDHLLELFGERITLGESPLDVTVSVRTLDLDAGVTERAARYLRRCVIDEDRAATVETVIETLVECGVLSSRDAVIDEVLAAGELLHGGGPTTRGGPTQEWQSVLARRGRTDGPVGMRVVGATTPIFDGTRVIVFALRSARDEFEVRFASAGTGVTPTSVRGNSMAFTAADDRGNRYVGALGNCNYESGSDGVSGTIRFAGPLDPDAAHVDLHFTTDRAEATIGVPVRWDET